MGPPRLSRPPETKATFSFRIGRTSEAFKPSFRKDPVRKKASTSESAAPPSSAGPSGGFMTAGGPASEARGSKEGVGRGGGCKTETLGAGGRRRRQLRGAGRGSPASPRLAQAKRAAGGEGRLPPAPPWHGTPFFPPRGGGRGAGRLRCGAMWPGRGSATAQCVPRCRERQLALLGS